MRSPDPRTQSLDPRGVRAGAAAGAIALAAGCSGGSEWVRGEPDTREITRGGGGWMIAPVESEAEMQSGTEASEPAGLQALAAPADDPVLVQEHGRPARGGDRAVATSSRLFRNTYYDFPQESTGAKSATVYDAACAPIAAVTRAFHDQVCVQGSGRLASGMTISFARRDCACADVCPRTGQRICFEQLDPARFPHGRGAMGRAITPLRTVAVDSEVIPLGTRIYIPEFVGVPQPDGTPHDGCFIAEDRGVKVVGQQIDIFTGDPTITERLNAVVPSNSGVHVVQGDRRCGAP